MYHSFVVDENSYIFPAYIGHVQANENSQWIVLRGSHWWAFNTGKYIGQVTVADSRPYLVVETAQDAHSVM